MDDKDIVSGALGQVGAYDVAVKGNRVVFSANAQLPPDESFSFQASVGLRPVVDALKNAIPGKTDDLLFNALEAFLGL